MSQQVIPAPRGVLPTQIWSCLNAGDRAKVIRLMAQLAFNLIAAQSELNVKESTHVCATQNRQNSLHPS
jgi:hypothetical protein